MDKKSKLINLRISPQEFQQIKKLADDRGMTVSVYMRYMATLLSDSHYDFSDITGVKAKKQLERDLTVMAKNLEKQRRHIDMLLSSINSTALKLESQFKRYRIEMAGELDKDFKRIDLLLDSDDE